MLAKFKFGDKVMWNGRRAIVFNPRTAITRRIAIMVETPNKLGASYTDELVSESELTRGWKKC